jgi:hypothetical protein
MSGRAVRDPALLEVRELRGFRDGNARRTQLVADPTLGRHILQGVNCRWEIARWIHDCFRLGVRRSSRLVRRPMATWCRRSQARDARTPRDCTRELATGRLLFGNERL